MRSAATVACRCLSLLSGATVAYRCLSSLVGAYRCVALQLLLVVACRCLAAQPLLIVAGRCVSLRIVAALQPLIVVAYGWLALQPLLIAACRCLSLRIVVHRCFSLLIVASRYLSLHEIRCMIHALVEAGTTAGPVYVRSFETLGKALCRQNATLYKCFKYKFQCIASVMDNTHMKRRCDTSFKRVCQCEASFLTTMKPSFNLCFINEK